MSVGWMTPDTPLFLAWLNVPELEELFECGAEQLKMSDYLVTTGHAMLSGTVEIIHVSWQGLRVVQLIVNDPQVLNVRVVECPAH